MLEPPYPHRPGPYGYPVPTSGYATASLVLGIIGVLGGWCLFGLPCILAIACGHLATQETKKGQKAGHGSAIAGLILGYICVVPMAFLTVLLLMGMLAPSTPTP